MAIAQRIRTCAARQVYHWVYVAPSTILSDEILETEGETPQSLRAEASSDGVCYLRIVRYLPHAALYRCQVAASDDLLRTQPLDVFCTEEQLTGILPYDCRLQQSDPQQPKRKIPLAPTVILARLSAHARACQPATQMTARPETPILPEPEVPLTLAAKLDVTAEEVAAVLPNPEAGAAQVQRALLFLAMQRLGYIQVRGKERWERVLTSTGVLLQQLRRWHRRTGQRVVNIVAEGCCSWRLLIGAPERCPLARAA